MPIRGKYLSREQFERNLELMASALATSIKKDPSIYTHIAEQFKNSQESSTELPQENTPSNDDVPKVL